MSGHVTWCDDQCGKPQFGDERFCRFSTESRHFFVICQRRCDACSMAQGSGTVPFAAGKLRMIGKIIHHRNERSWVSYLLLGKYTNMQFYITQECSFSQFPTPTVSRRTQYKTDYSSYKQNDQEGIFWNRNLARAMLWELYLVYAAMSDTLCRINKLSVVVNYACVKMHRPFRVSQWSSSYVLLSLIVVSVLHQHSDHP